MRIAFDAMPRDDADFRHDLFGKTMLTIPRYSHDKSAHQTHLVKDILTGQRNFVSRIT